MNGSCIAFNPCCKCDEKANCNICELTLYRNGYIKSPAADVVEVRQGEWRKQGNEKKCSLCEFTYYSNNEDFNFCPECGAKMDGERSENETFTVNSRDV